MREDVIVHTELPTSPAILCIELGGKPKWLPLSFGFHDKMLTGPIYSCDNHGSPEQGFFFWGGGGGEDERVEK